LDGNNAAREELYCLNQPTELFKNLEEHFWANLDETCLMASDGTIKVIGSIAKAKTELIKDDCRASITVLRIGFASGTQGPLIFLAKGKTMDRPSIKANLRSEGVPKGSTVLMTPNAFMTDVTWTKVVPILCKAIRNLPVIRDHPDWWIVIALDGFGSHINVDEAQLMFHKYKILILKEEGDTSHVNQAYDQSVAKADKSMMRDALATVRPQLGQKLDQWYLIAIAINSLAKIGPEPWIQSFIKVNMHPKHRVSADQWLKNLDERGILSAQPFFRTRTSLYDAMPAVWKKLEPEERHEVCSIIKGIYAQDTNEPVWTKDVVVRLAKYAPLDELHKLRACYHASLADPSVLVRQEEEHTDVSTAEPEESAIDNWCSWKPKALVDQYKKDKKNKEVQLRYFHHVCDITARHHWNEDKPVEPSAFLDCHTTKQQRDMLNPSMKQVVRGFILYDVKGTGAREFHAKRRLDMISGNVSSYSRLLNDTKRLKEMQELNSLVASVAQVSADKDQAKEKAKETKEEAKRRKEAKQKAEDEAFEAEKQRLLPQLTKMMEPYLDGIGCLSKDSFNKDMLILIMMYYIGNTPVGFKNWTKEKLCAHIRFTLVLMKGRKRREREAAEAAAAATEGGDEAAPEDEEKTED